MASDSPLMRDLRTAAHDSANADDFLDAVEALLDPELGTTYLWLGDCRGPQRTQFRTRSFDPLIPGLTGAVRGTDHPAWQSVSDGEPRWLGHLDESWAHETGCTHGWVIPLPDRTFLIGLATTGAPVPTALREALVAAARMAAIIDGDTDREARASAIGGLTLRQRLIVNLAASGQTNSQIATSLSVSKSTVSQELAVALAALGLATRDETAGIVAADRLLDEVG